MKHYTDSDIRAVLQKRIDASTYFSVGLEIGYAPSTLCLVLNGKREVPKGLANVLGFERIENQYVKKGWVRL